jgi:hypothetical protein
MAPQRILGCSPDILLEKMAKEIIAALTDGEQPDQNQSGS